MDEEGLHPDNYKAPIKHHTGELSLLKVDVKTSRQQEYSEYVVFKQQSFDFPHFELLGMLMLLSCQERKTMLICQGS